MRLLAWFQLTDEKGQIGSQRVRHTSDVGVPQSLRGPADITTDEADAAILGKEAGAPTRWQSTITPRRHAGLPGFSLM